MTPSRILQGSSLLELQGCSLACRECHHVHPDQLWIVSISLSFSASVAVCVTGQGRRIGWRSSCPCRGPTVRDSSSHDPTPTYNCRCEDTYMRGGWTDV
jgi:hypothetical protein